MTQTEFFRAFMNNEFAVRCFSKSEERSFNSMFLETTGLSNEYGHSIGYDADYPIMRYEDDHIVGYRTSCNVERIGVREVVTFNDFLNLINDSSNIELSVAGIDDII